MVTFITFLLSLFFAFFAGVVIVFGGMYKLSPELFNQFQKEIDKALAEKRGEY